MEKRCLYCEKQFTAQRVSKKYCSDNCKQMAYFVRNGLVLAGTTDAVPIKEQNNFTIEQEEFDTNETSQKVTATVKYENDKQVEEKERSIEQMLSLHLQTMEQKFEQAIERVKDEFSVKYDRLSAKAPIKMENSLTQNTLSTDKEEPIEQEAKQEAIAFIDFPKEDDELEGENDNEEPEEEFLHIVQATNESSNLLTQENQLTELQVQSEPPYKWINSKLIQRIEKNYMNEEGGKAFKELKRKSSIEQLEHLNWVTVRFRCLIESLIRLSNYNNIDRHTLLCVNDAFIRLIKSKAYNNLPPSYPYKELMKELCFKVHQLVINNQKTEQIVFRLPTDRKAQLISIRYQLLSEVPGMKFSELDFTEEQRQLQTDKKKSDEFKSYYNPSGWKERYAEVKKQNELKTAA